MHGSGAFSAMRYCMNVALYRIFQAETDIHVLAGVI